MQNLTGTHIDNYRLERLLFEDSPVQAYLGVHTSLKKERTVYLLHHEGESPPSVYMDELAQKAQAAARLDSHLGLVNIHAVGTSEQTNFFITDMVSGPTLAQVLDKVASDQGYLAIQDILDLSERILRAMEHAYIKGGLFVSLHPDSIKFRRDADSTSSLTYLPVLIDIGIAANYGGQADGRIAQPGDLIRSFGFFLYALFISQSAYHLKQPLNFDKLAIATRNWPMLQANSMQQLLEACVQRPSADFADALSQIYQGLQQFRSLPSIPGQMRLRDIYKELLTLETKPELSGGAVIPDDPVVPENDDPDIKPGIRIQATALNGQITHYSLDEGAITVGRAPVRDLVLSDERASRDHLKIERQALQVVITDQGSTNGTFLDNQRISAHMPVAWIPGQTVRIGGCQLELQVDQVEALPATPSAPEPDPGPRPHTHESLVIPSMVHVIALGREIPISDFKMLPENRMIGFHIAVNETYFLEPGENTVVLVHVVNFGREPVTLSLQAEHVPPHWISVAEPQFRLRRGEQRGIEMSLSPPRLPQSRAGNYKLKVSMADMDKSTSDSQQNASWHVPLRVKSFVDFISDVSPDQDGSEMTIHISVRNLGNGPESFTVYFWSNNSDSLDFDPPEATIAVDPGNEGRTEIRVSPKKQALIGATRKHQVTVQIAGNQGAAQTKIVEFLEKSRISFG